MIKNKYIILLSFVLCTMFSNAQKLILDENTVYAKGVYKTFDEFKFNKPSIPLIYKIDTFVYKVYDQSFLQSNHYSYRLHIGKDEAKKIGEIFGFCDGSRIFVNESFPSLSDKVDFDELQFVGLYSYFEQYMFMQGELGAQSYGIAIKKVININRGETFDLGKEDYHTFFGNDSIILKQFENDANKKEKFKDYIALFSLKHKTDGIECRDTKMTREEADLFVVRRPEDINDSLYYNRILSKIKTNPAFSDASLSKQYYSNGKLKTIGFTTRCNVDVNDNFMYSVGEWKVFYRSGQLKEIIEYDSKSKILNLKRFDKSGRLILK